MQHSIAPDSTPEQATARQPGRKGAIRFALAFVVVVGLLVVLLIRLMAAQHTVSSAPSGSVPLVGRPAPDFTITAWNVPSSPTVHLAALKGQPVVVNFWAPWCAPCQQEMPMLSAAARAYDVRGIDFIGVAFDSQPADALHFLRQYDITYPCGPDATGGIAAEYALPGIPVTVFVNRQGIVAQRVTGPLTQSTLDQALRALLQ